MLLAEAMKRWMPPDVMRAVQRLAVMDEMRAMMAGPAGVSMVTR
jgi:hypothetical protein